MCKVICVCNQKGGTAKTMTSLSLGTGLAKEGKKVLLIDADPQGSLTISLGYREPDTIMETLATVMEKIVNEEAVEEGYALIHHSENVDLLPANIELSVVEISLVNTMSRELILKSFIEQVKEDYDYCIIDCSPSLGIMTINALAAADTVLIPVQAAYLPVKGLQALIKTIYTVRRRLNPGLMIEGILLTMVDNRTNYAKEIVAEVKAVYGNTIPVFSIDIPMSVRAAETSAIGKNIYDYDPKGKAALAYMSLTKEVLAHGN